MDDREFREQLEQEEKAQVVKADAESSQRGLVYTDEDGVIMEWNSVNKAYFPKINDDFIAMHLMNYGTNSSENSDAGILQEQSTTDCPSDMTKAWDDYYNYCNQQHSGTRSESMATSEDANYTLDNYYHYYAYHYGEEYAQEWLKMQRDEQDDDNEETTPSVMDQESETKDDDTKASVKGKKKGKDVKQKPDEQPASWFDIDEERSTHVYVTGLPLDLTNVEYQDVMSKCGLIMHDPISHKPKLKLYRNKDGNLKGDGLCCYIKQESVDLALNILDGYNIRGSHITVERAKFELKGNYDATKKRKMSNKAKRRLKENQQKLFDWRPDIVPSTRLRFERIVILKNMFDKTEFERNLHLINELRDDALQECKKFGAVHKVQVHDHHQEGVISVVFNSPEEADVCITALNGRWFASRQVSAEHYDGKTQYQTQESETDREERLRGWEVFLEGDNAKKSLSNFSQINPTSSSLTFDPQIAEISGHYEETKMQRTAASDMTVASSGEDPSNEASGTVNIS